jgi:hypothetical protein
VTSTLERREQIEAFITAHAAQLHTSYAAARTPPSP